MADLWSQVYPNLLASLIWAIPGGMAHWHTRRQLRRHRAEFAALHAKHDALHQQIKDGTT